MPDAPNGYAPVNVTCPANRPSIRVASSLSPNETAWLEARRAQTVPALKAFLGRVGIANFNASSYIETYSNDISNIPNVALAISGGGLPAMMNGAALLKATDNRTDGALGEGQLGGLLQSATYVAALSGGSWGLSSVFMNNFTTVQDLQANLWDFSYEDILMGPVWWNNTVEFWGNVTAQVKSKKDAGFLTSSPDYW